MKGTHNTHLLHSTHRSELSITKLLIGHFVPRDSTRVVLGLLPADHQEVAGISVHHQHRHRLGRGRQQI